MTPEWELLFNVASGEGGDRNRSPIAMAQVQPYPKRLDGTKSICASRVLLHGAHNSCPTRTPPVRERLTYLNRIEFRVVNELCMASVLLNESRELLENSRESST
jgi:hypothetical protein